MRRGPGAARRRGLVWAHRAAWLAGLVACGSGQPGRPPRPPSGGAGAPGDARIAQIDRFGAHGHLFTRDANPDLPAPDQPIDFDQPPFLTQSLGPGGELVRYYTFDVQPVAPGTQWVFETEDGAPLPGPGLIDALPGEPGYSDFRRIVRVTVPAAARPPTDARVLGRAGQQARATAEIVNCPVVPRGSTARLRLGGEAPAVVAVWYRGVRVSCLRFGESELETTAEDEVPTSPILVTFAKNPGQPGGGPASGFRREPGTVQTHNVVTSLPGDLEYSPLWEVTIYDNAAFPGVRNEATARAAPVLAAAAATVNCPIVWIAGR